MKKILILFLLLLIPREILANTIANGTGSKIDFSSSSISEYFLRSDRYGIRVSFYDEEGKKIGNSIDTFDYRFNSGESLNGFDRIIIKDIYAKPKSNGDLKSRIDYINELDGYVGKASEFLNVVTEANYVKNYDRSSLGFTATIDGLQIKTTCKNTKCTTKDNVGRLYNNDPLSYLEYDNRDYFKAYFTSSKTIERYAKLASANIDIEKGNYYILIEPIFYISGLECNNYCGYYTSTEIGFMYYKNKSFSRFFNPRNISNIFYESLHLESAAEVGHYIFSRVSSAPTISEIASAEYLEKGYGMALISGHEVEEYHPNYCYKIIYRAIDMNNPFLDVDGNIRYLDKENNWYGKKATIDKYIYEQKPILTIVLKSSDIRKIRKENKNIDYSKLNKDTYSAFYEKYKSIFVD